MQHRNINLTDSIAAFIARYREEGGAPAQTQEAVLAEFPQANGTAYALGLIRANIRRRKAEHA